MNPQPSIARCGILASLAMLGLALSARTLAQARPEPPSLISFQGSLATEDGTGIGDSGTVTLPVVLRVFDAITGGRLLWAEQQTIPVRNGAFSVILGEGNVYGNEPRPKLASLFEGADASDRFVEMTVRGTTAGQADATVAPRTRWLSAPYGLLASRARSARDLVNGNGLPVLRPVAERVGVNTSNPQATLDVTGSLAARRLTARQGLNVGGTVDAGAFNGLGMAPVGSIVMWSGEAPPAGWVLCDGSVVDGVSTPDLRGRFVLSAGDGPGLSRRAPHESGGQEAYALTESHIPWHNHRVNLDTRTSSAGASSSHKYRSATASHLMQVSDYPWPNFKPFSDQVLINGRLGMTSTDESPPHGHDFSIQGVGSSPRGPARPHNTMPPFYVLAFIMRVR